jgi:hypothetical protein
MHSRAGQSLGRASISPLRRLAFLKFLAFLVF